MINGLKGPGLMAYAGGSTASIRRGGREVLQRKRSDVTERVRAITGKARKRPSRMGVRH